VHECYFIYIGYIGHMLHKEIDIAYMCYTIVFTLGYFVSFVSGVFLDTQEIVYLNGGVMIAGLPIYLLAEWIHCCHHSESDLKVRVHDRHLFILNVYNNSSGF